MGVEIGSAPGPPRSVSYGSMVSECADSWVLRDGPGALPLSTKHQIFPVLCILVCLVLYFNKCINFSFVLVSSTIVIVEVWFIKPCNCWEGGILRLVYNSLIYSLFTVLLVWPFDRTLILSLSLVSIPSKIVFTLSHSSTVSPTRPALYMVWYS